MKGVYVHPRENWDRGKCHQMSRSKGRDGCGTPDPFPGLISRSGSSYPSYGQTTRYNGGFIAPDGELYQSEHVPLPEIDQGYELVNVCSWGVRIVPRGSSKT